MELVRKTNRLLTISGNWVYYGIFLCPFCFQEVERSISNGLKQKSCGCVTEKLIGKAHKGKKLSKEIRQKIKENHADFKGINHPNFGKKMPIQQGLKLSKTMKEQYKNGRKLSRTVFKVGRISPMKGIPKTEETKLKMSKTRIEKGLSKGEKSHFYGIHNFGELASNWQGGISFEPYAPEFNKPLKQFVLERDNYTCQCPDCEEKSIILQVHHIDYDKKNSNSENLIVLCASCHTKTNGKKKRQYFIEFYQNIMMGKLMECLL